ncbi:hypothetical protein CDAR_554621 [Caerostris darwini]|uniref:Uncharacterized protein n=1 Tax=Caerostris darwini TaxID=1538125 RepID=A0AAV4PH09_9ARAC|nr:hypothetical protein CDAR_554621 [Caerostris darwini]
MSNFITTYPGFKAAGSLLCRETGRNKTKIVINHQVHGSGSSVAYLQYRRGTPDDHRGGGGIGTVPYALMILRSSGDHF